MFDAKHFIIPELLDFEDKLLYDLLIKANLLYF